MKHFDNSMVEIGQKLILQYIRYKRNNLMIYLQINPNSNDQKMWTVDPLGYFSCKSYFEFLVDDFNGQLFNYYATLWSCPTPSKVEFLKWLIILEKVNTKD